MPCSASSFSELLQGGHSAEMGMFVKFTPVVQSLKYSAVVVANAVLQTMSIIYVENRLQYVIYHTLVANTCVKY